MFGINKSRNTPDSKYVSAPESWLPEKMRTRLADASEFRESLTPFVEKDWQSYLDEVAIFGGTRADHLLTTPYLTERDGATPSPEEVRSVTAEFRRDADRAWTAYVTLRTQEHITKMLKDEEAEKERQRLRTQHNLCRVCEQYSDELPIGKVMTRALPGGKSLRSCEACHVVATNVMREAFGAMKMEDGRSRREVVSAFIGNQKITDAGTMANETRALSPSAPARTTRSIGGRADTQTASRRFV